jgi:hypothetical protein
VESRVGTGQSPAGKVARQHGMQRPAGLRQWAWGACLSALLLALACSGPPAPAPPRPVTSPEVARVGDSVYTLDRLAQMLEAQPETLGRAEIEAWLLRWVEAQAFAQEALRGGLAADPLVRERLLQVRLDLLRGLLEDRWLSEPVEIGDRELRSWARANPQALTLEERQVRLAWYSAADSLQLVELRTAVVENRVRNDQLAQPDIAHGRTGFLSGRDMDSATAERVLGLEYLAVSPVLPLEHGFVCYQVIGQRPKGFVLSVENAEGEIRQQLQEQRRLERLRGQRAKLLEALDYRIDLEPLYR